MSEGKAIGVIAIKGGVGKTTTVINLGAALHQKFNKRVLLVDGNFVTPHISLSLGLLNYEYNLHDVLEDKISPFKALYKHSCGLFILPASLKPRKINPFSLKNKIAELKKYFDFVIIDSSPSLNDEMLATMLASDELLVVTSPDHLTLSSTINAVSIAKKRSVPITGLIINKVRGKKFEISKEEIEQLTSVPVIGNFDDDDKILAALASTIPVTIYAPKRKISRAYFSIAAKLAGEQYKEKNLIENFSDIMKNSLNILKGGSKK